MNGDTLRSIKRIEADVTRIEDVGKVTRAEITEQLRSFDIRISTLYSLLHSLEHRIETVEKE